MGLDCYKWYQSQIPSVVSTKIEEADKYLIGVGLDGYKWYPRISDSGEVRKGMDNIY